MNDVSDLEQAEEDILTYTVSDEALEAATGIERGGGCLSHLDLQQCLVAGALQITRSNILG